MIKYMYNVDKINLINEMLRVCNEDGVPQMDTELLDKLLDMAGPIIYKYARNDYGDS